MNAKYSLREKHRRFVSLLPAIITAIALVAVAVAKDQPKVPTPSGPFTPTSTQSEVLYTVKPDGSLWWQEDVIGLRSSPSTSVRMLVSHALSEPKHVGDGWDSPQDIFPGGGSTIYVLRKNGNLDWFRHDGHQNGEVKWVGPITVGTGWNSFIKIIAMGDGVLYGILPDGTVRWNKHNNYKTGQGGYGGWAQPAKDISKGWNQFKFVFGGGKGVFYVVNNSGDLVWYRHNAYRDAIARPPVLGTPAGEAWARTWEGPKQIGTGWNGFAKIFSTGNGNIYGILPSGEMRAYRHLGWQDGSATWGQQVNIPGRWLDYLFVLPAMPSSAPQDDLILR